MVPPEQSRDEIVPDPSEALEFEAVSRAKPRRQGLWLGVAAVFVVAAAGAGWWLYGDKLTGGEHADVPVIHAPEGPVKVRPETPGGMNIPDRDKLVYDRMKGGVEEPRVERLLPPPELPKTPPAPVAEPEPEPVAEAEPQPETLVAEETPQEPAKPRKLEPGKVEQIKPPVKKEVKKPEPVAPAETAKPVKKAAPEPVKKASYQIQIAAVRSRETAQAEWKRLQKKHRDLLGRYSLNVVRVDLGANKGIFFRLRAGPIADESAAKALCENLSKRKVGCLIVRPGG